MTRDGEGASDFGTATQGEANKISMQQKRLGSP